MCFKRRSEFRYNNFKASGHPTYVFKKKGNKYRYIGLTSSGKTDGVDNIRLHRSPNPKNSKDQYIRPYPEEDYCCHFKKRRKGWKFSKEDKANVRFVKNRK